jgi:hypothetical protein
MMERSAGNRTHESQSRTVLGKGKRGERDGQSHTPDKTEVAGTYSTAVGRGQQGFCMWSRVQWGLYAVVAEGIQCDAASCCWLWRVASL